VERDFEKNRSMMTVKSQAVVGDIYAIPGGDRVAFGKIIYASEYFKDLILVRFFERAFAPGTELPENLETIPSRGIYTGMDSIKGGEWRRVEVRPVSDSEQAMSRRIVAGDVWLGDTHIGPASEAELAELPKMLVHGSRLVEKAVMRLA
jgi:hypothetical protein